VTVATTERLTIPGPDGIQLEALLHLPKAAPAPGMVVCHPHPLYGGDMHNPVVDVLCRAGMEAGYAALRFNFRGTGGSTGRHDGGNGEAEDVRAAVSWLASRPDVSTVDVLAGYSFGAIVALAAADKAPALLLVSPPLGMSGLAALPDLPLLAVTGDRDDYVDVAALKAAVSSDQQQVKVAQGADHFWWEHDAFLAEQAVLFLSQRANLTRPT
jgi:alpha/beta superfamily hydrolase